MSPAFPGGASALADSLLRVASQSANSQGLASRWAASDETGNANGSFGDGSTSQVPSGAVRSTLPILRGDADLNIVNVDARYAATY